MLGQSSLTKKQLIGYATIAPAFAFAELPLYINLPKFYYSAYGMSLATIGYIIVLIRTLDAFKDPLLGSILDRFKSTPYSRHNTILWFSLPFSVSFFLLFHPPAFVNLFFWFSALLLLVHIFDSITSISYNTLAAEITADYHERTRITSYREGTKIFGVVLAVILPSLTATSEATVEDQIYTFSLWSVLFIIMFIAGAIILRSFAPPHTLQKSDGSSLLKTLVTSLKQKRFWVLITIYFLNTLSSAIPATLILFFIDTRLQANAFTPFFLLSYFGAAAMGMGIWTYLSKRFTKRRSWQLSMVITISVFIWAYTLGQGDVWAYLIICILSGICLGADLALAPSLLADTLDEIDPGHNAHASFFATWGVAAKFATALAPGLTLPLLENTGFSVNPLAASSQFYLGISYALVPCLFKMLALFVLSFSTIDNRRIQ